MNPKTQATYSRYRQRLLLLPPTWDNLTPEEQDAWDYAIAPLTTYNFAPGIFNGIQGKPLDCIGKPLPPTHTASFLPFNPLNHE